MSYESFLQESKDLESTNPTHMAAREVLYLRAENADLARQARLARELREERDNAMQESAALRKRLLDMEARLKAARKAMEADVPSDHGAGYCENREKCVVCRGYDATDLRIKRDWETT